MTKAEERALETYPDIKDTVFNEEYPRILFTRYTERDAYIKGYEQAEKDINKEMLEIMEKRKDTLLADHDYDIHIEPAVGFGTGNIIVHYNDRIIEQLTWKDIRKISRILDIMVEDDFNGKIPEEWGEEEYYEEVLRRFKEVKK